MPAIELTRLKKQLAELRDLWSQPEQFVRGVQDLFDFYADHTHRTGQAAEPAPLLEAYQVPPPLLRQVVLELDDLATSQPQHTLWVCDLLWEQPIYETRLLAIQLLGYIKDQPREVGQRASRWMEETTDEQLTQLMFNHGVVRLAAAHPDAYLDLVEDWLGSASQDDQSLGVRAMATLVRLPEFDNFPPCFRLLVPLMREAPQELRPELAQLLRLLGERSPRETAYFFHEILTAPPSPQTGILIRMALDPLPTDMQRAVRQHMHERGRASS
jgi:hypothetical protein